MFESVRACEKSGVKRRDNEVKEKKRRVEVRREGVRVQAVGSGRSFSMGGASRNHHRQERKLSSFKTIHLLILRRVEDCHLCFVWAFASFLIFSILLGITNCRQWYS